MTHSSALFEKWNNSHEIFSWEITNTHIRVHFSHINDDAESNRDFFLSLENLELWADSNEYLHGVYEDSTGEERYWIMDFEKWVNLLCIVDNANEKIIRQLIFDHQSISTK